MNPATDPELLAEIARTPAGPQRDLLVYYRDNPDATTPAVATSMRDGFPELRFPKSTGQPKMDQIPPLVPTDTPPTSTRTMERAGTTVHEKVIPPNVLSALQTSTQSFGTFSADLQSELSQIGDFMTKQGLYAGKAATSSGEAGAQIAEGTGTQQLATDANNQQITKAFGLAPDTPDNILGRNMAIINQVMPQREQLASQIGAIEGTRSFLQDPVGWFTKGIQLQPLITQHNALVQQETGAAARINEAQELARNQTLVQSPMLAEGIRQKMLGDANLALANAAQKRAELSIGASGAVARTLMDMDAVRHTSLAIDFEMANLQSQAVSTTNVTSESESTAARDALKPVAGVNALLRTFNLNTYPDLASWRAESPEKKQALLDITRFGVDKDGNFSNGATPGQTIGTLYSAFGNSGLSTINKSSPAVASLMKSVVSAGTDQLSAIETQAMNAAPTKETMLAREQLKFAKTNTDRLQLGIDNWMKTVVQPEVDANNNLKMKDNNPYKLNLTIAPTAAALKDNMYAQFVLKPPAGIKVDDQLILSKAVADVAQNPAAVQQIAQQYSDFYRKGMDFQRKETNMTGMGFPEQRNSYPMVAKVTSQVSQPFNAFDPVSVQNYLTRQVATAKAQQAATESIQFLP